MIDFKTDTPTVSFFEIPFDFHAISCISNEHGELQLYSNGCQIIGANHRAVKGGDSINAEFIHEFFARVVIQYRKELYLFQFALTQRKPTGSFIYG